MNFTTWNAAMTAAKSSGVLLGPRTCISLAIIKANVETRPPARQEGRPRRELRQQ